MDAATAPLRDELRGFTGYRSARMEAQAPVLLNANESPWPSSVDTGERLHRYPEPQPRRLVQALARLYGVAGPGVLVGRGSDEGVDLLVRACCRAGRDAVLVTPPTFGMYAVCARVQDAAVLAVPLRATQGWQPDAAALIEAARGAPVRLVFLCSPNNPVGGAIPDATVATVAAGLRGRALVVVDEAYGEFAGGPGAASLLPAHPNLVVLRTLSKAHALAGARVGCVLAAAPLVAALRRIQAPYPIPAPSAALALRALQPVALAATHGRVQRLVQARAALATALAGLPAVREVLPGAGNFLVVRFAAVTDAARALADAGVAVRDVSAQPGLEGCLRISVGAPAENQRLLAALGALRSAAAEASR